MTNTIDHETRTAADQILDQAQIKMMEAFDLIQTAYDAEGFKEYHKAFLGTVAESQGLIINAHALLRHRLYKK